MRKALILLLIITALFYSESNAWGKTGHRIVGKIAEHHLTNKARKNIDKVLQNENLAEVSNFMDFIRSNDQYNHMSPWHYSTIPDGMNYAEAGVPSEGDAIQTIERLIQELKSKNFSDEDESFALKCLVHLVGDIHQPLHVGNGKDKGGNDFDVTYFYESSNLHRVWDSQIIDGQQYSYTEYTDWINHATDEEVEKWQEDSVLDWANESKSHRDQVYDMPENKRIAYEYDYKNLDLVNQRLLQAGIRLAGVLNEIYG